MSYRPPISYAKNWYTPVRYQYPKLRTEYKKTYRSLVYIGVPLKKNGAVEIWVYYRMWAKICVMNVLIRVCEYTIILSKWWRIGISRAARLQPPLQRGFHKGWEHGLPIIFRKSRHSNLSIHAKKYMLYITNDTNNIFVMGECNLYMGVERRGAGGWQPKINVLLQY